MSDNDNLSPFVVPKLCIKRVPVQQQSPRKQKFPVDPLSSENALQSAASAAAEQPNVLAGGGLKLVLRVPKDSEPSPSDSAADTSEENLDDGQSSEKDSEASKDGQSNESESIKLSSFLRSDDTPQNEQDAEIGESNASVVAAGDDLSVDESASSKRRRRKKRFRLSKTPQKTKTKSIKTEVAEPTTTESTTPQRPKRNDQKKKDPAKKDELVVEEKIAAADPSNAVVDQPEIEPQIRFPSPTPQIVAEFSPLQLLLDHLLRGFLKKDPDHYFAYPVTEDIAPNYSSIISQPMDFLTIRKKVDANEYKSLLEFKKDIELISSNAMTYNQKNTIYYMAAKKLQNVAEYMFSKEKLNAARKLIPQLSKLTMEEMGFTSAEVEKRIEAKKARLGYYSCIVDDMCPEEVIEQVRSAAAAAKEKLHAKHPNIQVLFAGASKEQKTKTLKMLLPEHIGVKDGGDGEEKKKTKMVVLGDLVPKLKEGTPGLPRLDETKDLVVPVTYLDNGSFSSFAPHYDSTWATLNKEESDLLLATFGGDEHCVRYIDSIRTFTRGTSDNLAGIVENMIDDIIRESTPSNVEATEASGAFAQTASDAIYEGLQAANACDDDDVMIVDYNDEQKDVAVDSSQEMLNNNAALLQELHTLQNQRLSSEPPFVLTQTPGPSENEIDVAAKVVSNIQQLAAQAAPVQLVSSEAVREAMFVGRHNETEENSANDEYDMDVLREFFMDAD